MTGVPPHRSGVYTNSHDWRAALPDAVTLPTALPRPGLLDRPQREDLPPSLPPSGLVGSRVPVDRQRPPDLVPRQLPLNGIAGADESFDWGPLEVPDDAMSDEQVVIWAEEQLARSHERPFFLAVGIFRPHLPWYVPPGLLRTFPLEGIRLPEVRETISATCPPPDAPRSACANHERVVSHRQWPSAVQGYLASIHFADAMLGACSTPSTRAPTATTRSSWSWATTAGTWARSGTGASSRSGRRRPVRPCCSPCRRERPACPVGRGGGVSQRTVSLLDLHPTLIELCGLPPPTGSDGRSLVPLLADPQAAWDRPVLSTVRRGNHSVRSEDFRYTRYADGSEELYDHRVDPAEWTNLADDPRHAAVKAALAAWLPESDAPAPPAFRRKRRQSSP